MSKLKRFPALVMLTALLVASLPGAPGATRGTPVVGMTAMPFENVAQFPGSGRSLWLPVDGLGETMKQPDEGRESQKRLNASSAPDLLQDNTCVYPDFSSGAELTLKSAAARAGSRLRLTPSLMHQAGSAWCNYKQFIQGGFATTFQFQITDVISGGADGLAFVIQNDNASALGAAQENIGYGNIVKSLAVEFDTWENSYDPSDNHISVQACETGPNSANHDDCSLGSTAAIPNISDGQVHTTKIEYTPDAMQIFLDNLTTPVLTVPVDFSTILSLDNGAAWVGFTAATGGGQEIHDILNWAFYPAFDLSVTKFDSPDSVIPGNSLTYEIVIVNNGPAEVTEVRITDTLPLSVTFNSAASSQGNCDETGTLIMSDFICNLGSLPSGATAAVTISVTSPAEAAIIKNIVRVAGNESDPNLSNNTATESTLVNHPPEARDVAVTPTDVARNEDDLTLGYTYYDQDGHPEGATRIRWYRNNQLQPAFNDEFVIPATYTLPGEDWHATVRPYDGQGYGLLVKTAPVSINEPTINTPPQARDVHITPALPGDDDHLQLIYTYADADGNPKGNPLIRWYKVGDETVEHQEDYDNQDSIPSNSTAVSETWFAQIFPYDGQDYGNGVYAHSVTVQPERGNTPPQARNVYLAPAKPGNGDYLKLYYDYYDADGDPEGDTLIRWMRDEVTQTMFNDLTVIPPAKTLVNQEWCVYITPHDEQELGEQVGPECVTITKDGSNTPPEARDVYIAPWRPRSDQVMELHYTYFDADGDPEGDTQIRWCMSDTLHGYTLQEDFNDLTFVAASATISGQHWYAIVVPHDGQASGTLGTLQNACDGSLALPARASAPGPVGASFNSLIMTSTWAVKINHAPYITYLGFEPPPLTGTVSNTVYLPTVMRTDGTYKVVNAQVLTSRGIQFSEGYKKSPKLQATQDPIITENDNLTLFYVYKDQDDDPLNFLTIRWYRDSVHLPEYDNRERLPFGATSAGEEWFATVRAHDGFEYGPVITSELVDIRAGVSFTYYIYLPSVFQGDPNLWDEYSEENDTREQARLLNFGQDYTAYPDDLDDWYYAYLTQTASLHVQVTNCLPEHRQLLVYDSERNLIGHDGRWPRTTMEIPNTLAPSALKNLSPGFYYVRVLHSDPEQYKVEQLYYLVVSRSSNHR